MAARGLIRVGVGFMPSESELGGEGEDDSEGGEEVGDTLTEYRDERSREGRVQRRQRAGSVRSCSCVLSEAVAEG